MLRNLQEIMAGDATHALVRLWSENLSEAEAMAIHTRVQGDSKLREELETLHATFASIKELAGERKVAAIARDHRHLLRERRRKQRFALGIAAGILATLGAILAIFLPGPGDRALPMHFTRVGEQQSIELPDSSVVMLNTGSELLVDYGDELRRVLLERGEAFFEVAEDPDRPFMVDLGAHAVTALGTTFNVRKEPERFQVAVIEGAVAFHEDTADVPTSPPPVSMRGAGPRRVEAGWVAEFDASRNELTAFRPESMDRYRDWRSGILSFDYEPLSQVIQELNRYLRRKILIEDASVMGLRVVTVVHIQDIDTAFRHLEQVLPIKVTRHYDRIVITAAHPDESRTVKDERGRAP